MPDLEGVLAAVKSENRGYQEPAGTDRSKIRDSGEVSVTDRSKNPGSSEVSVTDKFAYSPLFSVV